MNPQKLCHILCVCACESFVFFHIGAGLHRSLLGLKVPEAGISVVLGNLEKIHRSRKGCNTTEVRKAWSEGRVNSRREAFGLILP